MRTNVVAVLLAVGAACGLASRLIDPPKEIAVSEPEPAAVAVRQFADPGAGDRLRKAQSRRENHYTGQVVAVSVAVVFGLGYAATRRSAAVLGPAR